MDKILNLAVAGLGVAILFLGGLLAGVSISRTATLPFVSSWGWAVALFLIAGLLAAGAFLPKTGDLAFPIAAISLGTALTLLFALFKATGPYGSTASISAGFLITLILGFIQAAAAVFAYLLFAGIVKFSPKPPPTYGAGQYGPGYPGQNYGPPQGYGPPTPQQGPPPGYGPPSGQPGQQPNQPGQQPNQPGQQPNQPGQQPNQPGQQPNQPGQQYGQGYPGGPQ